jgi:hypothetical protein
MVAEPQDWNSFSIGGKMTDIAPSVGYDKNVARKTRKKRCWLP